MQIVATESIIILLLNAMVCPVTIVVPHSYCAKWSNLTSTYNVPPAEANKGRRKIRGITCPPGRVPSAPPARGFAPCTPLFAIFCSSIGGEQRKEEDSGDTPQYHLDTE